MLKPKPIILDASGRHDDAAELLEATLTVFERTLGPNHHEVVVTLANLGAIDARRGNPESAEQRPRRALAINERTLGSDPQSKQTVAPGSRRSGPRSWPRLNARSRWIARSTARARTTSR